MESLSALFISHTYTEYSVHTYHAIYTCESSDPSCWIANVESNFINSRCLIFTFIHSIFTQCHSSRYQNEVTRSLPTYHTYLIWYSVQFDPLFHQLIPAGVVILTDQQLDESPSARYCLFCLSPFQKQHDSH